MTATQIKRANGAKYHLFTLAEEIAERLSKLKSGVYIRFDLGADRDNGSDQRIEQVRERANKIFEEAFSDSESLVIYAQDYRSSDNILGNKTPDYLYEILKNSSLGSIDVNIRDEDDGMEYIRTDSYFKVSKDSLEYRYVLLGIGNNEQGRTPSIGQTVYFISPDFDKIFHMYDDRGCDVFAKDADTIRVLYDKFNRWILDYNRSEIDSLFWPGAGTI